ncbi:hypothetical protein F511_15793 [Dorcoceras hygrometricum]|uniref:Uncharacterized protein n=1 Tax=Dorcoceras hygrometricum TaxID=472368 RepID=A0A2Z7B8N6_9LAMI|nr:hypothetical protein F511_15793 [Dorcoceras hygrometricum]
MILFHTKSVSGDLFYVQEPEAPDLTKFLKIMSEKCFNAQELIKEDLLCHFIFRWKGVQLVGDLGDRMTKVEMMNSMKDRRANPEGTSSSRRSSKGKRKASTEEGERRFISLDFIRRLVPDQDFDLVRRTPDLEVLEAASLHFMQEIRAQKDREKESLLLELEPTRAKAQSYKAKAQSFETGVLRSEEENKSLQAEVEKLMLE